MALSNAQLTKLGKRLRGEEIQEDDLNALDEFRQTYGDIDQEAFAIILSALEPFDDFSITKRKRKTQQSIVDKLRRLANLRLPQMQDIAGCRIVVEGGSKRAEQLNTALQEAFQEPEWSTQRRDRHAHGYRAIHIIVKNQKFYEIQLRTYAQDVWANLVEGASTEQNTLKYGGNEEEQPRMNKLKQLAEQFCLIDEQAHTFSFKDYDQQIREAIQHVLSY